LFEKAAKALDIDAPQRAFYSNGLEFFELDALEQDEVIYISLGEPFLRSSAKGDGPKMVNNFIVHEKLGEGGFGSVMKGVHSETGDVAAIKYVSKASFKQIADLQRVYQEIQALRSLHHPHVIKILDVGEDADNVVFIMEFAPGGELRHYVERRVFLPEEECRVFFKQMVRAIHYVHSKKIIHRDLKLENILLDAQNRCKIVDFGLSDYVSTEEKVVTDAGTEAYLAPEVWNGTSSDSDPFKLDVWALGVILYALAHGKLPFSRPDEETCTKLLAAGGPEYEDEMSSGFKSIVNRMLVPDPLKRATVDAIIIDGWVTQHRFADMQQGSDEEALSESAGGAPKFCSEEPASSSMGRRPSVERAATHTAIATSQVPPRSTVRTPPAGSATRRNCNEQVGMPKRVQPRPNSMAGSGGKPVRGGSMLAAPPEFSTSARSDRPRRTDGGRFPSPVPNPVVNRVTAPNGAPRTVRQGSSARS